MGPDSTVGKRDFFNLSRSLRHSAHFTAMPNGRVQFSSVYPAEALNRVATIASIHLTMAPLSLSKLKEREPEELICIEFGCIDFQLAKETMIAIGDHTDADL